MEGGFTMNQRIVTVIFVAALVSVIPLTLALAGNNSGGASGSGGAGSPDTQATQSQLRNQDQQCEQEPLRTRDRERLQKQVDVTAYVASDGKTYEWKRSYTIQVQKYEDAQNPEALNSYLYRIAHRFRFQHEKDIEGFVKWAQQNKPWNV
jgi:hypothetical protein